MFRSLKFFVLAAIIIAIGSGLMAQVICQIGNLESPQIPVPNVIQGNEIYAYLVHPVDQCGCPDQFVQIQNVKMWLEFEPWMVPANFTVRAGIRPAIYDASFDKWVPDGYFYEGHEFDIEVMNPGQFLLEVPAPHARWMNIYEYYFLTLTFETPLQANILADGMDMPGIAYVSPDALAWQDLYLPIKTSGGKPIIWGDVLCGPDDGTPVPIPEVAPRLEKPFPNPFNPGTTVSLVLKKPGHVKVTVHDSRGRLVNTLANEHRGEGTWQFKWDGTDENGTGSAAGLYFFRAETADGISTRKAALIK